MTDLSASVGDVVNAGALEAMFRRSRIQALVCRSAVNVAYLAGIEFPGTLGRLMEQADSPRHAYVIWRLGHEPFAVLSEISAPFAAATGRATDVRIYRDYVRQPESILAEVLQDLDLQKSRVGFDQAWFGARRWIRLTRLLPHMQPVDCTDDLDLTRGIKTSAEIALLRDAANTLDEVFSDVFPTVRPGDTERSVHSRIIARAIESGLAGSHGILQASSNPVLYGGESERGIVIGETLRTDYVAYRSGYAANLSRVLSVGKPGRDTVRSYEQYLLAYRDAVRELRVGAVCGDIHAAIVHSLRAYGFEAKMPISGHGIGVWFHQQRPMIVEGSQDVLRAGMVVALEPISDAWHLQDEYLITDEGPERISTGYDIEELRWVA